MSNIDSEPSVFPNETVWGLSSDKAYLEWREKKLLWAEELSQAPMVEIKDLSCPTKTEQTEVVERCKKANMAFYQTTDNRTSDEIRGDLRNFVGGFNLKFAESHRSAGEKAIVAITPSDKPSQKYYMPYSKRAMNWHTDGYYNAPNEHIHAMVLHCVRPANDGGQSQFFDNEIAYIRLRDKNPLFIKALMHPQAMTIPENHEENGNLRPVSVGPVFSIDKNSRLAMRYTARTKSIEWRNDELTRQAVSFLQNLLEEGDPYLITATLKAAQGVLCNNSLHNRTGFDKDSGTNGGRLLFRVRFFNRVREK